MRRYGMILAAVAATCAAPVWAAGKSAQAPRTPSGAPSLDGLWSGASYKPLERPDDFKTLAVTPDAARAYEARVAHTGGVNIPPEVDPLGQATSEFPESGVGLARIRGEIRSSIIVDPADGKIPWSDAGKARKRKFSYDGPEARPDNERCMASSTTGAPTVPAEDANVLQIVQTPGDIVLLSERYHDARIIRMTPPPARAAPRSWLGESHGRWDGDTLVVRTQGLLDRVIGHGDDITLSGDTVVEERFTRVGPQEILYAFTVTDPTLFTQPWRGEVLLRPSPGRWFPYDCHEGNYSIVNVLQAARLGRQETPKAEKPPEPPSPAR